MTASNTEKLLEIKGLSKYFKVGQSTLKAVDNLSLDIYKGETLGLVGESGCGKSTVGRTVLRLYEPTAGEVLLNGENIYAFSDKKMKETRAKMQMIFQDPYASLDPRMSVEDIVSEPFDIFRMYTRKERREKVLELLNLVGLGEEHIDRFPHEFSGGQRQRVGIARAMALEPSFIVCDEPISALDVSIQAQIVNLLKQLQEDLGLTLLFIAHDLSMVRYISDRVAVMYLGVLVELSDSDTLYEKPLHPYTKALLSAIPIADPKVQKTRQYEKLEGEIPSPIDPKPGCRFAGRCKYATDICRQQDPVLEEIEPGHFISCHRVRELNNL